MRTSRSVAMVIALSVLSAAAQAGVTDIRVNHTIIPDGTQSRNEQDISNWVVNDILIDFEDRLAGQQMILELDTGSIFQDAFGNDTPPNPELFDIPGFTALRYDTFVSLGGTDSSTTESVLAPVGAAVDIRPEMRLPQFDTEGIDYSWHPSAASLAIDKEGFLIARITLSPSANGNIWLYSSVNDFDPPLLIRSFVSNGFIGIPEPSSATTTVFAVLSMTNTRRRK